MELVEDLCEIPFGGGAPVIKDPNQFAGWVKIEDRVPLMLALSLYTSPIQAFENYRLMKTMTRVAAWIDEKTGLVVIGCRGTSIGSKGGGQDINDDRILAGFGNGYCDLSIVKEASGLIETVAKVATTLIFVGHSLGGTAAFCLCQKYGNSRSISYNGGAAPTNPVLTGPKQRATFYHVNGDLISTHMSPNAANIIRIKKDDKFDILWHHSTERLLAKDGKWAYSNPTEEDIAFQKWTNAKGWFQSSYENFIKKSIVSPIPGSARWFDTNGGNGFGLKFKKSAINYT